MEPMTPEERLTKIENAIHSLTGIQAGQQTQIEKQNVGIRDLIVVSRSILESQKEVTTQIGDLREALDRLTNNVDKLTDNIDKLSRGRGPNGNI